MTVIDTEAQKGKLVGTYLFLWTSCFGRCHPQSNLSNLVTVPCVKPLWKCPHRYTRVIWPVLDICIQPMGQLGPTITHNIYSTLLKEPPQGSPASPASYVLVSNLGNSALGRTKQFGFTHAWLNIDTLSSVSLNQRLLCFHSPAPTCMSDTGSPTL